MSYINLRYGKQEDVDAMMYIKHQLPLKTADGNPVKGGFLLGTTREQYLSFILNDHCLVAEDHGNVVGFGIMLHNASLRNSDIWQRRHQAAWEVDINDFEDLPICYFEQLAFLPGYKRAVLKLAYQLVMDAFRQGHTHLFATTVHKPVLNIAAVPFIKKADGGLVGRIDEYYPEVGNILSDIYLIDRIKFYDAVPKLAIYPWLVKSLAGDSKLV